ADHDHIGDIGMGSQDIFQFTGKNVFASRDHHVVVPTGHEQASFGVKVPHIAGVHQPAHKRFGLAVGIPAEHHLVADVDSAGSARGHRFAVTVEDPHGRTPRGPARRVGSGAQVSRICDGHPAGFGGAVEVV